MKYPSTAVENIDSITASWYAPAANQVLRKLPRQVCIVTVSPGGRFASAPLIAFA